jgi:hypothetical protein
VQHHAADHLHVEMAHAHGAHRRLAHGGKGFGQQVVEAGAVFQLARNFTVWAASSSSLIAFMASSNAAIFFTCLSSDLT